MMLVFISDLHLSDMTTCGMLDAGAFEVFVDDLKWMVQHACERADKSFTPVVRVDLVMLGDVFDLLRSPRWHDMIDDDDDDLEIRPWTPELDDDPGAAHARLAAKVERIVTAIIAQNMKGIDRLRELVQKQIEVRDRDGRPHFVPVRIWYMAGNHDWMLYVGRPAYDGARKQIIAAFGLSNPADQPFPHTIADAPDALQEAFERHGVIVAQHGDIHDGENYQLDLGDHDDGQTVGRGTRAKSSVGDAFVIEFLNRLPAAILRELAGESDQVREEFERALKEIENVRPYSAVPQWLESVLQQFSSGDDGVNRRYSRAMRRAIRGCLERLLQLDFVKSCGQWDFVDKLQVLSKAMLIPKSIKFASALTTVLDGQNSTYLAHAIEELNKWCSRVDDTNSSYAKFIVFGHSHMPEVVPLDIEHGKTWFYLNTGTWRVVHQRCVATDRSRIRFVGHYVMSSVAVYDGNERRGRPYETWAGTLGLSPHRAPGASGTSRGDVRA